METTFWITALIGTALFALKMVISFFSGDAHDVDADGFEHGSDKAFKIFSIHSFTGFLMLFGWVGLACTKQYALSNALSISLALTAGILMMLATAYLFKWAALAVSTGTRFHIEEILGRRAIVYHKIPARGVGKIHITISGHLRELHAVSDDRKDIQSFTEVMVNQIIDHQTVSVCIYNKEK